jgi:hypothetical protein
MAGAGYKLFNTGDVLTAAQVNTYLMEQTVMVFANAAARTTALSGVVSEGMISYLKDTNAVEVYDGSNWVSSDDPNAIQNTIVDAKGDLITATAADTPARLAVGNNGDTLLADSSTSTGLRWQVPVNANPILNSAFQVWQRGTSFAVSGSASYTADRWQAISAAYTAGLTVSRQATNDTTNLPNIQYCARVQRDSGNTSTAARNLQQCFESVNSIPYAGKTVTLSFYARVGANFSAASGLLGVQWVWGTGTDQNLYLAGYTGQTNISATTSVTPTTTWQRFTITGTVGATATEIGLNFNFAGSGTAGANDYFEVTGVQMEVGSVATPFKTYAGTLQGELAACQRYFQILGGDNAFEYFCIGSSIGTTDASGVIPLKATMRGTPTLTFTTASNYRVTQGTTANTATVVQGDILTKNTINVQFTVASGLTAGNANRMIANNTTAATISISAEL